MRNRKDDYKMFVEEDELERDKQLLDLRTSILEAE